jgi:hypothetical protein
MDVSTTCPTCGLPLGDRAELYEYLKSKIVNEILSKKKTIPNYIYIDDEISLDCSDILKTLQVNHDCCKMHLISIYKG